VEFAERIDGLLDDQVAYDELTANACQWAEAHDWSKIVDEMEAVYRSQLNE